MNSSLEHGRLQPYNPLMDELSVDMQAETPYAVLAKVPVCAIWNLLYAKSEEGVPQGRSMVDQEMMKLVMTRILLRGRWMDEICQIMFSCYKGVIERRLEASIRSLDAARRSGHKDRLMLIESKSQSNELKTAMLRG